MSHQATSWAFEQDQPTGAKFLLVAIANAADKSGVAWVGRASLAGDCSCNVKTVSDNFARLERAGLIARRERRRQNGSRTSDWIVLAPQHAERGPMIDAPHEEYPSHITELAKRSGYESSPEESSGEVSGSGQVTNPGSPEPSVEPSVVVGVGARAKLPKVGSKPVNAEAWETTAIILDLFNAATSKRLRLVTSAGEPSEAAKRIYGRVRAYPDITVAEHGDIIRRTLKSKWWGTTPPAIGVVYGPKVFEDNITRGLDSRAARDPDRFKRTRSVEED